MDNVIQNFDQIKADVLRFLKYKFSNSIMTTADIEDSFQIGLEKMWLNLSKPHPTLTPSAATLKHLSLLALIDMYRAHSRKPQVSLCEQHFNISDDDLLEQKEQIEAVIAEIQNLTERRKKILEEKYDMKHFSSDTCLEEIVAFKSRTRFRGCALAQKLNCPSDGALRQELHNTVIQLRTRFLHA